MQIEWQIKGWCEGVIHLKKLFHLRNPRRQDIDPLFNSPYPLLASLH